MNVYVDWRTITGDAWRERTDDFEHADKIVRSIWDDVIDYLESNWRAHIV